MQIRLSAVSNIVLGQDDKSTAGTNISEELIEQYQKMIDEFRAEAEELMNNLSESNVPTEIVLKLTRLIEKSPHSAKQSLSGGDREKEASSTQENGGRVESLPGKGVKKSDIENVQADYDTLELSENDTANLLIELSSENKEQQALAIARLSLLKDDIALIVFNYLSLKNNPKSNRLAAQIVKKVGSKPSNDFLSFLSPGLEKEKLKALLQVADIFYENDLLYKKLEELLIQADNRIIELIEKIIFSAPMEKSEKLLLDFLSTAKKEVKSRLLKTAVILKVKGLTSLVNSCLIPHDMWTEAIDEKLVAQAALAAGELTAPDNETIRKLLNYLKPKSFFGFKKHVPYTVRSAVLLSLGKINPPQLRGYLLQLSNDKNPKIATQARKLLG